MSLSQAAQEAIWLKELLNKLSLLNLQSVKSESLCAYFLTKGVDKIIA